MVYGGRQAEIVYNDFWVYNLETSHWFNWTTILASGDNYPIGRYKGILQRTNEGLIIYSGSYTDQANLAESDLTTGSYLTYVTACQDILNIYNVTISEIGTSAFASKQAKLYALTNSSCFLLNTPTPSFASNISYIQGVWFFNLTHCQNNCSGNGVCSYGTCYCNEGFFGDLCQNNTCAGSFCIYDNEFFSNALCIHCSGYGNCINGECICLDGYSGSDCSMQSCVNNCTLNGDCMEIYPISQCDCYGKYGGDICNVSLCLNNCNPPHGTCNLTTGLCTCEGGLYGGIDCSVIYFTKALFYEINILLVLLLLIS